MSFLKKIINKIPSDKKDHVILGIIVGFPLILAFNFWGGITAIAFVGLIEVWQGITKKGKPELMDFVYSAAPIAMFLIIRYIYHIY